MVAGLGQVSAFFEDSEGIAPLALDMTRRRLRLATETASACPSASTGCQYTATSVMANKLAIEVASSAQSGQPTAAAAAVKKTAAAQYMRGHWAAAIIAMISENTTIS